LPRRALESWGQSRLTTASISPAPVRSVLRRKLAKTARWLHIYLSMVSFAAILFFSVTGLTLNHPKWFAHSVHTRLLRGTVDPAAIRSSAGALDVSDLARQLRAREHLHGAVDYVRVDDAEITFSYRAPGYSADADVDEHTGHYTVVETSDGAVAVLNDLHRGRDSGAPWGWLIDASAVLLTIVSATGLILLLFLSKRRITGVLLAGLGLAVCVLLYCALVP
jgi:uncharacterized protein